jgi:hypothetical protein
VISSAPAGVTSPKVHEIISWTGGSRLANTRIQDAGKQHKNFIFAWRQVTDLTAKFRLW